MTELTSFWSHPYDASITQSIGLVIIGEIILSQILPIFIIHGIFLYLHRFQTTILDKYPMTRSKKIITE